MDEACKGVKEGCSKTEMILEFQHVTIQNLFEGIFKHIPERIVMTYCIQRADGHSADFSLDISWSIFFTYESYEYMTYVYVSTVYISIFIHMRLPRMLWAIETTSCISTLRFSYAKVCRCFVTTPRQGGHRWIKCLMFGVGGFKPGMGYGWVQQIPCQWAQWAKLKS